jgi:hypothetical protein
VIMFLSLIVYQTSEKVDGGAVISSMVGDNDQLLEEAAELPQEVKIQESDESQAEVANAADPAGALSDTVGAASDLSGFSGSNVGGGLEGFADALGSGADKMTGASEKTSASFFGSKQLASSFVFVIDNSNSMTKGRFETALNELAKTVMALNPQQSYYIIFYSDTAYGLFHPQTARNLVPATPRNTSGLETREADSNQAVDSPVADQRRTVFADQGRDRPADGLCLESGCHLPPW